MRPGIQRRLAFGLLALGLGSAAGCGLIVGDGDYKVGADGGGGGSCPSSGSDSTCVACEKSSCCNELTACQASSSCTSFVTCEANCTTSTSPCNCAQQFPAGEAAWLALLTCAQNNCSSCPTVGIGDPCLTDFNCTGATTQCSGWCSDLCTNSSNCAGAGPGGTNAFGQQNYCLLNASNSDTCFPGCVTNSDCQAFAGTICDTATSIENKPIHICTLPATGDAGH